MADPRSDITGESESGRRRRTFSLGALITVLIAATLVVGFGASMSYFLIQSNANLVDTAEDNLRRQSDVLTASIEDAMNAGQAGVAVELFADIETLDPSFSIELFGPTGETAFTTNTTIDAVNRRLGGRPFAAREVDSDAVVSLGDDPQFRSAVSTREGVLSREAVDDKTFFVIHRPLPNQLSCVRCHGEDTDVRGVIRLPADVTTLFEQTRWNLIIAAAIVGGAVLLLTVVLTSVFRRTIVRPITQIGAVCRRVMLGRFDHKVGFLSDSEIGQLGDAVNSMIDGLKERFELSKYVSASTLQAVQQQATATALEVTLLFTDIRGFTSYSLEHPPERVVASLNHVLNVQTEVIHRRGGDVDKYVGDAVVALFSGQDKELRACETALLLQGELVSNPERYHPWACPGSVDSNGLSYMSRVKVSSWAHYGRSGVR